MLSDILTNKTAVRVLKVIVENELTNRTYSMQFDELSLQFTKNVRDAILLLADHKLLLIDESAIAVTERGKEFIAHIDALKKLLEGKGSEKKLRIIYDLSELEKKRLFILSKMEREEGVPIALKNLVQELYPYEDTVHKSTLLSRYVSKLESINLLAKEKSGRDILLTLTSIGKRVVKEQIEKVEE